MDIIWRTSWRNCPHIGLSLWKFLTSLHHFLNGKMCVTSVLLMKLLPGPNYVKLIKHIMALYLCKCIWCCCCVSMSHFWHKKISLQPSVVYPDLCNGCTVLEEGLTYHLSQTHYCKFNLGLGSTNTVQSNPTNKYLAFLKLHWPVSQKYS